MKRVVIDWNTFFFGIETLANSLSEWFFSITQHASVGTVNRGSQY